MLLALDTAFNACSVALASLPGELASARHVVQNRGQAETLVPMVDEVLRQAGVKPEMITRIVVTRGPGTFAGVRVGIAFARSLALATGARVLGLSSFEALAGSVALEGSWPKSLPLVVAIPAGRAGVSAEMFTKPEKTSLVPKTLKGPEIVSLENFYAWAGAGEGIIAGPRMDQIPEAEGFAKIDTWPWAEDLIRSALLYPESAYEDTATPLYLRPPDATPQSPSRFSAGS